MSSVIIQKTCDNIFGKVESVEKRIYVESDPSNQEHGKGMRVKILYPKYTNTMQYKARLCGRRVHAMIK